MKKHINDKSALMAMMKHEATAFAAAGRAVKLISLIILCEQFKFSAEDLKLYLDSFEDVLDHYNKSNDYKALLEEWDSYFEQELGARILWKTEQATK